MRKTWHAGSRDRIILITETGGISEVHRRYMGGKREVIPRQLSVRRTGQTPRLSLTQKKLKLVFFLVFTLFDSQKHLNGALMTLEVLQQRILGIDTKVIHADEAVDSLLLGH